MIKSTEKKVEGTEEPFQAEGNLGHQRYGGKASKAGCSDGAYGGMR